MSAVFSPVYAQAPAPPAQLSDIGTVVQNVIKLLAPAAAIAFLVMLLVGAYKFMTSGGDPKGAASARSTLTYALIGVVLLAVSWLILQIVNGLVSGNILHFNLGF